MIEPRPCPFCKSERFLTWHIGHYDKAWCVECLECGACGPRADTMDESVELWNKRVKE